ncbi:hypothetical protein DQ384_04475 [Sphaerisporangium album]|uniref:DUF3800 domain-containing protein n=1 Tax=Sphaerisporangium album TaxID=509200 RepID=A0A367FST1_9ACTN|nr:hypothetical protein [Sphaerisporangium album]RCG32737.1 hypothetical protein DQ384_04475 [Sphaerisporangium album]
MLTAYIDESLRRRPDDCGVYALAAVIVDSTDHDDIRAVLRSLRLGKNTRLHWREESSARQLAISKRLADMPIRGIVAVHLYGKETRTERARRRCLQRLLVELDGMGVSTVIVESRSPGQDHLDLLLLMAARKTYRLSKNMTVSWQSSYEEPLLWAADSVVGATTWWLDGRTDCFDLLTGQVHVICLD